MPSASLHAELLFMGHENNVSELKKPRVSWNFLFSIMVCSTTGIKQAAGTMGDILEKLCKVNYQKKLMALDYDASVADQVPFHFWNGT